MSVVAAAALIALKLSAGFASGSLGLLSEALHSGTDLVAALLTFFAVGVATRPADRLGDDATWDHAEGQLKLALDKAEQPYLLDAGGGNF